MRWESARQSTNVQDRRGLGGAGMVGGGGIGMLILVLLISFITGRNPLELLSQVEQTSAGPADTSAPTGAVDANDPQARFVAGVLGDTEDTWNRDLRQDKAQSTRSPSSSSSTARCARRAGSPRQRWDRFIARAITSSTSTCRSSASWRNALAHLATLRKPTWSHTRSVITSRRYWASLIASATHKRRAARTQTPCPSGWNCRRIASRECGAITPPGADLLDEGDVDEGLRAAAAIGDDRLQRQGQGYVAPESFTHGSSEQRASWLRRGLQTGDPDACDTFGDTR